MAFWAADPTSTVEASFTTTAEEDVALRFDVTALLVGGGVPSAPQSALYRVVDNGADVAVTLADTPTIESNTVVQRLRGLTADTTYKLRVSFLTSGNRRALTLVVICVE